MKKMISVLAAGLSMYGALLLPTTVAAEAATAPNCRNADLTARYVEDDHGAGHTYGRIVLKNVSAHACRIRGFGGISYVGHDNGTQVGAAADRVGTATAFVLRPGQRAISRLDQVNPDNYSASRCRPTRVDGFRVYVPNSYKSKFIKAPGRACANPNVHLMSHYAYTRPNAWMNH